MRLAAEHEEDFLGGAGTARSSQCLLFCVAGWQIPKPAHSIQTLLMPYNSQQELEDAGARVNLL